MRIGSSGFNLIVLLSLCFTLGCPGTESQPSNSSGAPAEVPSPDVQPAEPGESEPTVGSSPANEGSQITPATGENAPDEGYGHLKGRFILPDAPQPATIAVNQDVDFCGKFGLVDEKLQTSADGGLANVAIWLLPDKESAPKPHASYTESAEAEVVLDNKNCLFSPRVLLVRTTQKFKATNSDKVAHNTRISYDPDPINPSIAPGKSINHAFPEEQRRPVTVSCSSHPWMKAMLVVRESPYMALTDADGNFEIRNLPVGNWTFQFWQEGLGYVRQVNVGGKSANWERGRHEVTITSKSVTDLGDVKLKIADYPQD